MAKSLNRHASTLYPERPSLQYFYDLFLFIKLLHFATMQVTILYSLDENANIVINKTLQ